MGNLNHNKGEDVGNSGGPSNELVAKWSALLDGELPAEDASRLHSEPGAGKFLQGQGRFNSALKHAMTEDLPGFASPDLMASIRANIQAESKADSPSLSVIRSGKSRIMNQPALRYAATLLIGLLAGWAIFGDLGISGRGGSPDPTARNTQSENHVVLGAGAGQADATAQMSEVDRERHEFLTLLSGKATDLGRELGSTDLEAIEKSAIESHFPISIPKYDAKVEDCKGMRPVHLSSGKIRDKSFHAITFCAGPVKMNGDDVNFISPTKGKLNRIVMVVVDGDLRTSCSKQCPSGTWAACDPNRALVAKYDKANDRTFLVFVPGQCSEERARQMAEPLLVEVSNG